MAPAAVVAPACCVATAAPQAAVQCVTVAAGGRYDSLLRALWPPPQRAAWPAPGAVGATLNVDKLVALVDGMSSASVRALHACAQDLGRACVCAAVPSQRTMLRVLGDVVVQASRSRAAAALLGLGGGGALAAAGSAGVGAAGLAGAVLSGVLPGLSCADVLVASRGGDGLLEMRLKVRAQ